MAISLEDYCEDIVGKAQRGHGLSDAELSQRARVSIEALHRLKSGRGDEETARKVAPTLHLNPDKLAASLRGDWYPRAWQLEGLYQANTAYNDLFVNAYLVWDVDSGKGAFFDTGANARGLVEKARREHLAMDHLFLTHTHRDHVMDLSTLLVAYPQIGVYAGEREALEGATPIPAGETFAIGRLKISTRLTWGHSPGGLTYVIDGLQVPVAIVGDAMFAGSMGGGMVSYADALRTNREEILSLPNDTVLCPGHGPLTSVGEEKAHNPFF